MTELDFGTAQAQPGRTGTVSQVDSGTATTKRAWIKEQEDLIERAGAMQALQAGSTQHRG